MLMANSLSRRAMQPMAFSLVPTLPDPTIDPPFGGGGIIVDVKTPDLQFFPTEEGFYDYQKNQYIYQMKDQLGNVRLSFGKNSTGALEITDVNDYYPFGMNHLKSGNSMFAVGSYKAYKYGNKELQEFGAYDFEARTFWQDIPRMGQIDPLAEKMPSWSPYAYSFNNPIRYGDPTGMEPEEAYKPTPKEAAAMAAHVYGDKKDNILIGGWRVSQTKFEGVRLTDDSGFKSQVYERVVDGKVTEYTYATAGTEADWGDVEADVKQPLGLSSQYSLSATNATTLSKALGDTELIR